MTKSQYPYPPDEFDVRGPDGAPVGVHREPRSGWSSVWPFLVVAVICGGIGVAAISYLSDGSGSPSDNPPAASDQSTAPEDGDDAEDPDAEAPDAEDPDAEVDEDSEAADDLGEEEPSDESSDDATDIAALVEAGDTTALVRVLNDDSGVSGEAGRGAGALEAQGFSNVVSDNYPGDTGLDGNAVWYVEGRAETAAAVAAILGVPAEQTSQQNLGEGDIIVVVREELAVAE